MKFRVAVLLVFALTVVSFAQTSAPAKKASASTVATKVAAVRDAWIAAFNAKQADKIAALYTEDAVFIAPDGTSSGRDAIKAALQKQLDSGVTDLKVVSTKSGSSGSFYYDVGDFSQMHNGKEERGRYLVNLKLVGGKWLVCAHADVPAMP